MYNTRFLDIVEFVNTTLHTNLERLTPNGGLVVWNIFLPKPDVPPAIAANYRQVKVTQFLFKKFKIPKNNISDRHTFLCQH